MTQAVQKLKIDVTSDYLCPFCLLGMRQLELALDKVRSTSGPLDVEICMHPFQLNGLISDTPMKRSEYGEKKFGQSSWNAVCQSLACKFRQVGIDYRIDGEMSQSHLAHRLTEYAAQTKPSQQLQVAMDIFNLYHVEGIHLSNKDALAKIAVDNGLFDSTERAVTWLNGNGGNVEVKKMYGVAQKCGITAVPFFVFNDKYAASGAMGVEEFVNILGEIRNREGGGVSPPAQYVAQNDSVCVVPSAA